MFHADGDRDRRRSTTATISFCADRRPHIVFLTLEKRICRPDAVDYAVCVHAKERSRSSTKSMSKKNDFWRLNFIDRHRSIPIVIYYYYNTSTIIKVMIHQIPLQNRNLMMIIIISILSCHSCSYVFSIAKRIRIVRLFANIFSNT